MKMFLMSIALLAVSGVSSASTKFTCFSRYYSANKADISVSGEAVSNDTIKNLQVISKEEGLDFNLPLKKAITNYKPRTYKGYNMYLLGKNPMGVGFQSIDILLPNNIVELSGHFDAYVSDSNADSSGSSGHFRVLCQTK